MGDFIGLLELIFPSRCIICKQLLKGNAPIHICSKCIQEIEFYNKDIVPLSLGGGIKSYCDGVVCAGKYQHSLKKAIRDYKFNERPSFYRAFGELIADKVNRTLNQYPLDVIVPVPMSRKRIAQRGYNQAALIALRASQILSVPLEAKSIVKVKDTQRQSSLGRQERLINLNGAFEVTSSCSYVGKTVLLIDDIITTGSTLNECSKALKAAGAKYVFGAVIATTRD